jgi:DNA-binding NarL/FixJ family response regulator
MDGRRSSSFVAIRNEFPEARILVLTTYKGDVQIVRALKSGARGYLLKNSMNDELVGAIRAVYAGRKALSAEASVEIAEHATDDPLTPAELRVLRLIAEGNATRRLRRNCASAKRRSRGRSGISSPSWVPATVLMLP